MDVKIFRNSYVIFVITFILLYVLFYLFGIGYKTEIIDDKPIIKFSWRYPLGLSLIVWIFWHFYLYPVNEYPNLKCMDGGGNLPTENKISPAKIFNKIMKTSPNQKINMKNWY